MVAWIMLAGLVLVALVTTLMTTPRLSWIERREARTSPADAGAELVGSGFRK
jgi:hypothetical protein